MSSAQNDQARTAAISTAEKVFHDFGFYGNAAVDTSELELLCSAGVGLPTGGNAADKEAQLKAFFDANTSGKIQKAEWLEFVGTLYDTSVKA